MTIGIYFKFRRFWSVRNVDLMGLIAFAPGLLLVAYQQERLGYLWLFVVGAAYLVRLLIDPVMVRRPLLEPNLSVDGLTFTGVALLIFLVANVVTGKLTESDQEGARRMDRLVARQITADELSDLGQRAPGYPLFHVFATFSNNAFVPEDQADQGPLPRRALVRAVATRSSVILGTLGHRHRDCADRLPAFRQHPHRGGGGRAVSTVALHVADDLARGPRGSRRAVGLGRRGLSASDGRRDLVGAGRRGNWLPTVLAAALVQLLLASRTDSFFGGRGSSLYSC